MKCFYVCYVYRNYMKMLASVNNSSISKKVVLIALNFCHDCCENIRFYCYYKKQKLQSNIRKIINIIQLDNDKKINIFEILKEYDFSLQKILNNLFRNYSGNKWIVGNDFIEFIFKNFIRLYLSYVKFPTLKGRVVSFSNSIICDYSNMIDKINLVDYQSYNSNYSNFSQNEMIISYWYRHANKYKKTLKLISFGIIKLICDKTKNFVFFNLHSQSDGMIADCGKHCCQIAVINNLIQHYTYKQDIMIAASKSISIFDCVCIKACRMLDSSDRIEFGLYDTYPYDFERFFSGGFFDGIVKPQTHVFGVFQDINDNEQQCIDFFVSNPLNTPCDVDDIDTYNDEQLFSSIDVKINEGDIIKMVISQSQRVLFKYNNSILFEHEVHNFERMHFVFHFSSSTLGKFVEIY